MALRTLTVGQAITRIQAAAGPAFLGNHFAQPAREALAAAVERYNKNGWSFLTTEVVLPVGYATTSIYLGATDYGVIQTSAFTDGTLGAATYAWLGSELVLLDTPQDLTHPQILATTGRGQKGTLATAHTAGTPLWQQDYTLPEDFNFAYDVTLVRAGTTLHECDLRAADRRSVDTSSGYTIYEPASFDASSQLKNLRLLFNPGAVDYLLVKYYRRMNPAGDAHQLVDCDAGIVDNVLDWATALFLEHVQAPVEVVRTARARARDSFDEALAWDTSEIKEDQDTGFISSFAAGDRGPNTGTAAGG